MSESAKALVRRFYDAFNQGKLDALDAFVAQDFVDHNPMPGQASGRKGLKDVMAMFRSAFPDIGVTPQEVIAEGDKVVVRTDAHGTNTGPLMGMPATGKRAEITAIDIWRVRGDKLTEAWHVEELLQMMMQLGIVPPPPGG